MRARAWLIIGVWVLVALAALPLQPRLQQLAADESDAFQSRSAESTRVDEVIAARFPEGGETTAIVAYTRDAGITPEDELRIEADAKAICAARGIRDLTRVSITAQPPCGARPQNTATGGVTATLRSQDNTTLLTIVQTRDKATDVVVSDVAEVRAMVPDPGAPGLRAYVTGQSGFAADQSAAFEGIDGTLLAATFVLLAILLLAIYRSPILALVPLAVVGIAYVVAAALVYAAARAGLFRATGQATAILIVLMFGAGTDYCLLLVARYREELQRGVAPEQAMPVALRQTAPTILSAGGIVVAAMLVVTLASYNATRWMGPVLAIGTAVTVAACLTLLPALLTVLGQRAFRVRETRTVWPRIGALVRSRPVVFLTVVTALLVAGALGNLRDRGTLDFSEQFRTAPESVQGLELLRHKFPSGQAGPTQVIVDTDASAQVLPALRAIPGVAGSDAVRFSNDAQKLTQIDVVLDLDPFTDEAAALISRIRSVARKHAGGGPALVGGTTAQAVDSRAALRDDAALIVPLALGLVFLIVAAQLRAIVAPLYIVVTVLLSYAFALGVSALLFSQSDPALPLFTFVFLVALGVDYNVFLFARIREARRTQGEQDAVITGLVRTGGVITSAGLILAATFCTLLATELESLFHVGFTVALGLLVDTFLVRVFLVPSIALLLGRRNWWPG